MCLHDSVIRVIDSCDLQHLVDFATELKESRQNQSKTTAVAIQNKVRKAQVSDMSQVTQSSNVMQSSQVTQSSI